MENKINYKLQNSEVHHKYLLYYYDETYNNM
jgi:hypothetical protein